AATRARRTSPTLLPSAVTSRSPPTDGRSTGGMRMVAILCFSCLCSAGGGAECIVVGEDAHFLIGDAARFAGADRAFRVAADLEFGEAGAECFVEQEAADERLADAEDDLDD